jgi:hypothetical protein
MSASPSRLIPWNRLPITDQRRVHLALSMLQEFIESDAHVAMLFKTGQILRRTHPLIRFIINGQNSYLCAFYLSGANCLQSVLRAIGLTEEAGRIDSLLATAVGALTLGEYLRERRNTIVAHPQFSPDIVSKRVHTLAPLTSPDNLAAFGTSLRELRNITLELYLALRDNYPVPADALKGWSEGVNNEG